MAKNEKTYLFILDENGKRQATFLKGIHGKELEDLQAKADAEYPGATQLVGYGEDYFNQFAQGKIYVRGEFVDEPPYVPTEAELLAAAKAEKLSALQQLLNNSDYKAIKFAEGALTAQEYEPTKVKRQAWRDAYNNVEAAKTLEAVNAITWPEA